ncbi:hypothetical protein BH23VER1_BH23VER1_15650 [soil metagenome]
MTPRLHPLRILACTAAPFFALALSASAQSDGDSETEIKRPLDALVGNEALWSLTAEAFAEAFAPLRFQWNSAAKSTARFAGGSLGIWGAPVGETLVDFRDGAVWRIGVSIYNRGDDAPLDKDEFEGLIADWKERIAEETGTEPEERGRSKTSAVRAEGFLFQDATTTRLLEYSDQREVKSRDIPYRAEFLKLRFAQTPKDDFFGRDNSTMARRKSKADLPDSVTRKPDGDVYIQGVPMVDQGQKGYCVVASAERVMRYYGVTVDQHEMAQIADSDSARGTSTVAMVEALKSLTGRLKLRVSTEIESDWNDFKKMANDYNRFAKRNGKNEVDAQGELRYAYDLFDPESLKESKTRGADFSRFKRTVRRHIDEGIPMLWSVYLGFFPEAGLPQAPDSGHMRLIIGYNDETEEILYSDSWGAGHELKRMPEDNAYTATTGLFTIQPTS